MSTVSQDLATFASEITADELGEETWSAVEALLVDTIGCSVAAYASPPVTALRRAFGGSDGRRSATVVGTDRSAAVADAALVNASMSRYLDYNDCYMCAGGACHPSDHVMALLSVAEAEGATGAQLVESIVAAYEVEARGLEACPVRGQGFDYVAWGVYSSAAAVGTLMDLTHDQLVDAIGIAGASNAPLYVSRRGDVSMWKGVAHPYATHNAIQACEMARHGLSGPTAVFEGPFGFFDVVTKAEMSFDAPPDHGDLRVLGTAIKPYATGYYIQSAVAGTLELLDAHDVAPGAIDGIEVRSFDHAVSVLAGPEKRARGLTRETADHSIPYTVAVAALDGEVTAAQYAPERLDADDVHDMIARVTVEADSALSEHRETHPRHIPAVTTIRAGGETYRTRVDCPPGHPENPMSRERLEAKFAENCRGFLSDDQVQRVVDLCGDVERLERVDPLLEALVV
jgi:2-methylcitrate dehydratase